MKRENPLTLPAEYDMIKQNWGETVEYTAFTAGQRVDVFLAEQLPELTRSAVQKLLEQGLVTCGGRPVKKNMKTEAGQIFAVILPEVKEVDLVAQDIPLDIVYED